MNAESPQVSMFTPIPAQTNNNNNNDSSEMESVQRSSSNEGMDVSSELRFSPEFESSSRDENQMQDSAVNTARGKTI